MEKERRTKALLLSTLVVVVATVSIAFAAMSRTLSINGIGKMDTASWSVYFDKLEGPTIVRGAKQVSSPSISQDKGTVQDINVKLSNPKDEISYTVDIVNAGTIDAEITMIKDIELTEVQKKVFEFKVTYTDTGEILQNGDLLPKKTTKNITINIKFKDDITEFDLPSESQIINLSYQITYTQYDGEVPIGPDGGVTTEKTVLARGISFDELMGSDDPTSVPFFNGTVGRGSVESISFVNNTNVPSEAESTKWDASEAKDESIIGWYQNTDSNEYYEVYIGSDANIYAPSDSSGLYTAFVSLKEINFNNFNTSDAVDMSWMFAVCMSLSNLDINNFNTNNVTNMSNMFLNCAITNLNLSNWDTSNVTDMSSMFSSCSSLTSLDLSSFNTTNVTSMVSMFDGCSSLISLDLSSFNNSKVTDMSKMFLNCEVLITLDLSSFGTTNVATMDSMFDSCSSLTSLNLSSFNTSNVTSMHSMFSKCSSLTSIDLSSFNTLNVATMDSMFKSCTSLTSLNLSSFNTSNVTSMHSMFSKCSSLTSLDLSSFNTSNVATMDNMFDNCSSLTSIDLSSFNTSNVTSMDSMFDSCKSLTSLDLSSFNTSNVTDMRSMFSSCSSLTSLDLSSFNTTKVTSMNYMFFSCSSLTELKFNNADFSNVSDFGGNAVGYIFYECSSLVSLDLRNVVFSNSIGCRLGLKLVPISTQIIVKDEEQRTWVNKNYASFKNVVLPSEL